MSTATTTPFALDATRPVPVSGSPTRTVAFPATVPTELTNRERFAAVVELSKPGITRMVTITSMVGFTLAALGRERPMADLAVPAIGCVLGTALSSSGANALNQWWERRRDGLMRRTAERPLPEGRLSSGSAFFAGFAMAIAGALTLLVLAGPAPALVAIVTTLLYLLVYTPLKPVTPLNTLVGAIPGALPPLIGWTATAPVFGLDSIGGLSVLREPGGWCLFLLMVVWQIPHFLAIAWMYRDDYARGGYRMLPIVDPTGSATATTVLIWSVTLLIVTLAPVVVLSDRLGLGYGIVALASGCWFIARCWTLARTRSAASARRVFFGSIIHLPVVLLAMMLDAILGRFL